jgi:NADH dehydrogenase
MTGTVFVTGATGFIGGRLMATAPADRPRLKLFSRQARPPPGPDIEIVTGDLLRSETYEAALAGVETVVHMAALTGKCAPDDYRRVNVEATARLVEASVRAGVRNVLLVSSIAAGYPNKRFYPYARSKAEGERVVAESGLAFTILRPTIVLGGPSPAWASLARIAGLPIIPLLSGPRAVHVQPVHVDDVARALWTVVQAGRFRGETFDVGGKDPLTMEAFLGAIHTGLKDRPPRFLPMPLGPIRVALAAVEPVARPVLPATAGQFAVFANDSAVRPNWLMDQLSPGMPETRRLIADLCTEAREKPPQGGAPPDDEALTREAQAFTRHLIGKEPGAEVASHYAAGVKARGLLGSGDRFDRFTLAAAGKGGLICRLADAYCGLFHRRGLLRRRLILLMAILEQAPATHAAFDRSSSRGPLAALAGLAAAGVGAVVFAGLGAAVFLPARLALGAKGRG